MSKRPQDNAFQQQRLKAWQPLLTPTWVIGTFLVIAIIFIPLGAGILSASNQVYENELEYQDNVPASQQADFPQLCTYENDNCETVTIEFAIDEEVKPPIYVYYKLTNFYQNHRRYVKSRSDAQLQGDLTADIGSCDPLDSWEVDGTSMPLYPCGLIANSVFNDTFSAVLVRDGTRNNMTGSNWNSDDIAWKSDANKFIPAEINEDDYTNIGPGGFPLTPNGIDDPHFMVWMRTAGLPNFKKLYAVIEDTTLQAGDTLEITLINTFPVIGFEGTKAVVISTTSWLGGKNDFLGYSYIVVGVICLLLAIAFGLKAKMSPRDLGDMKYFNWPQGNKIDAE